MTSSTKNLSFSKAGATLVCICGDTDTYRIGQLDREKWANEGVKTRNKWWCLACRQKDHPILMGSRPNNELDKLMELLDD